MSEDSSNLLGLDPDLAVKNFFQDPDWVFKSAVGGVMNASSLVLLLLIRDFPILIPIVFSLWAVNTGYVLRTIRQRIKDPRGRLPGWNDFPDLFVSGMSWLAVLTGFLIILITVAATDLLIASILAALKNAGYLFALWASGSIILILTLSFLFNLLLTATMANFAQEESMISAFSFIRVIKHIFRRPGDICAAWMLGLGIHWLSIVGPCATIVGIFFLPSTVFAGQLITASLVAQAWASSDRALAKTIESKKNEIDKVE